MVPAKRKKRQEESSTDKTKKSYVEGAIKETGPHLFGLVSRASD
jgi:hypothetical protein